MKQRLALFMPSVRGGGAERVMVTLASEFAAKGYLVDLVLTKAEGPYLNEVPETVNIVDLKASRVLFSLFGLILYLRREKPVALLSTIIHTNVIAVIAKMISRVSIRVVLRESNTVSYNVGKHKNIGEKIMLFLVRRFYPLADQVIAVSNGVATDLMREIGLSENMLTIIYSPVITPSIFEKSEEEFNHPWFEKDQPPVVLGVGRLSQQKGFDVLIKAVIKVREVVSVRLIILGEGSDRNKLEILIKDNGLENEVSLPGFVQNPFPYMKNSAVFVLSSRWEGLPNVLIQAMACGTAVISTNCPSGPDEILESGKWGDIVNVDNVTELAESLRKVIERGDRINCKNIKNYCVQQFGVDVVSNEYLAQMLYKITE